MPGAVSTKQHIGMAVHTPLRHPPTVCDPGLAVCLRPVIVGTYGRIRGIIYKGKASAKRLRLVACPGEHTVRADSGDTGHGAVTSTVRARTVYWKAGGAIA